MKPSIRFAFSALALLLMPWTALGAACCGGAGSVPALITGDQQSQWSASLGYRSLVVDQVGADGYWNRRGSHVEQQTFRIDGARLLADRWQAGISIPLVREIQAGTNQSSIRDPRLTLGYEFLPDWDYHPFRPRGVLFSEIVIPTGDGYFKTGLGAVLTKTVDRFDFELSLGARKAYARDLSGQREGQARPGWGGNFGAGAGYTRWGTRLGGSILWEANQAIQITTATGIEEGAVERLATASLSLGHAIDPDWYATLTYSDQTWFGAPTNTRLGRGLMLTLTRQWLR